ncbi:MAG: hypothetical protein Q9219_003479 [cf. Caloplaca sp. 3 TL-2023]
MTRQPSPSIHGLNLCFFDMVVLPLFYCMLAACSAAATTTQIPPPPPPHPPRVNGTLISSPKLRLAHDTTDPRFSIQISKSETKLPPTPVLMNAVELSAQYAEMDFVGRAPQRQGIVLPSFPQIEIAVLPEPPARSVEVRLVLWAIYEIILDMVSSSRFCECEVVVRWEGLVKAHVYFTLPLDDNEKGYRLPPAGSKGGFPNQVDNNNNNNNISEPINTLFSWRPTYKPSAHNLPPASIFLLSLSTLKTIAPHPLNEQVPAPFHISPYPSSVDANLQVYFEHFPSRRRPAPPFLRYSHVLEAVRRLPGWMLARRRFAEFFASVEGGGGGRPIGVVVVEKGEFVGFGAVE